MSQNTANTTGNIGLSKWVFLRGLLSGPEDLEGQPEYEAWKQETGKTDHEEFFSEKIAEHAAMKHEQGISYSVYKSGDDPETPLIHVGDFADEQGALKALITEKGEAFAWNQEGQALATRYESLHETENTAASGTGLIRVHERGIAPMRREFINQAGLESALAEAEQQVAFAGSIISARRFLQKDGGVAEKMMRANTKQGNSTGMLVWSDTNISVQDVGNNQYIVHDSKSIEAAMTKQWLPHKTLEGPVKLSYNDGDLSIQKVDKSKDSQENDSQEQEDERE
jgi:hypothetical protein